MRTRSFAVFAAQDDRKEIAHDLISPFGPERLRMELDTVHRKGAVRDSHDGAVIGVCFDPQNVGERAAVDDERVVARGAHGRRTTGKEGASFVAYFRDFAVHRHAAADDARAARLADGLMPQADAAER